jgi:uncharacterized protein YuzE
MSKPEYEFTVRATTSPVVELTADGLYIWFNPGGDAVKTIVKSRWPFLAVDVDKNGDIIGIEHAPLPKEFSISKVSQKAGVRISDKVAARAEIRTNPSAFSSLVSA